MKNKVDNVNHVAGQAAEDVLDAIHGITHLFRAQQQRALRDAPHDLTQMEGKALFFFSRRAGATLSDLVAHTGRDKGQLARLIGALRERGLLEAKAEEHDRRTLRLYPSASGKAIVQSFHRQVQRLSGVATEGLSPAERQQLLALLAKIRGNLEGGA